MLGGYTSEGKINLQKQPVDVANFVTRAGESSQPLIDARRCELQVTLPDEALPLDADVARNESTTQSVKHRIMVVDDNKDSADSLATLLRLAGNDVRTVHDGRQTLVVAAAYQPDLVLLDIGLPGMGGYEVARRLRAMPWISKTTLVALTGYGGEEDRRQAQAAGFDHHMVKPVDFDALHGLLTALAPTTA